MSKQGKKKTTEVDKDASYNGLTITNVNILSSCLANTQNRSFLDENYQNNTNVHRRMLVLIQATTFCRSNISYNVYERQVHVLTDPGLLVCWHLVQSTVSSDEQRDLWAQTGEIMPLVTALLQRYFLETEPGSQIWTMRENTDGHLCTSQLNLRVTTEILAGSLLHLTVQVIRAAINQLSL